MYLAGQITNVLGIARVRVLLARRWKQDSVGRGHSSELTTKNRRI